ncbi:unnamed protein product [Timema podura]|uniref:Uncharacterized protein n=1 Tax=Timema podura TaxID=61482 RepID=A0ABN7P7Q6_TIMPD|nr:unnamed protein product [Timema podura]
MISNANNKNNHSVFYNKYSELVGCNEKGMETEHQAQYQLPLDDFYHCRWYAGVEGFPAIPRASPWENLSSPNMYCTEYCHLGTGWPVRAVVDPGAT